MVIALQLWALALLVGTGMSLGPQMLDFSSTETELNHIVVGAALGIVYLVSDQNCQPASVAEPAGKPLVKCRSLLRGICALCALPSLKLYIFIPFLLNFKCYHETYNQKSSGI